MVLFENIQHLLFPFRTSEGIERFAQSLFLQNYGPQHTVFIDSDFKKWGGVRLVLLALSVLSAFAQAEVDNANNSSLT